MRQDWKASCCQFMRWPQTAAIDRVDSKDAVVILRDGSGLSTKDFSAEALDDLLRASLALGVSALDRYLHERIVKRIVTCLRSRDLHSTQEKLAIPATLAVRMTEAWSGASQKGKKTRPANQLRISLQEALHTPHSRVGGRLRRPSSSWALPASLVPCRRHTVSAISNRQRLNSTP